MNETNPIRRSSRKTVPTRKFAAVEETRGPKYLDNVLKIVKKNFCKIDPKNCLTSFDLKKVNINTGKHDIKWDINHKDEPDITNPVGE